MTDANPHCTVLSHSRKAMLNSFVQHMENGDIDNARSVAGEDEAQGNAHRESVCHNVQPSGIAKVRRHVHVPLQTQVATGRESYKQFTCPHLETIQLIHKNSERTVTSSSLPLYQCVQVSVSS